MSTTADPGDVVAWPRMELPSEPEWDDGLPRLCPLGDGAGPDLCVGVRVPGGKVVGAFLTEKLAREFVGWLGAEYAARAMSTMTALDEIADVDLRRLRNERVLAEQRAAKRRGRLHHAGF